jgi:hypothetical protein
MKSNYFLIFIKKLTLKKYIEGKQNGIDVRDTNYSFYDKSDYTDKIKDYLKLIKNFNFLM